MLCLGIGWSLNISEQRYTSTPDIHVVSGARGTSCSDVEMSKVEMVEVGEGVRRSGSPHLAATPTVTTPSNTTSHVPQLPEGECDTIRPTYALLSPGRGHIVDVIFQLAYGSLGSCFCHFALVVFTRFSKTSASSPMRPRRILGSLPYLPVLVGLVEGNTSGFNISTSLCLSRSRLLASTTWHPLPVGAPCSSEPFAVAESRSQPSVHQLVIFA